MGKKTETVHEAFRALAARDIDALTALLKPDIDIRLAPPGLAGKPSVARRLSYPGHAGLLEWLREIQEDFTDISLEARHVEEIDDDTVLVLGTVSYEVGGSGAGMTAGWVCTFDGDQVSRIDVYWDWNEARAAATQARSQNARTT